MPDQSEIELADEGAKSASPEAATSGWKPTRLARTGRESLAVLFWLYVGLKPFVFDVDSWLIGLVAPSLSWVVEWRFAFFLGLLGFAILLLKPRRLAWWALWVLLYPFVLLFWRLPQLLFRLKSWTLGLAVVGTAIALIRSIRFTVPVTAALVTGLIMATFATRKGALIAAIALLVVSTLLIYARLITRAFVPGISPFSKEGLEIAGVKIRQVIEKMPSTGGGLFPEAADDDQRQTQLEVSVLYSRACHFLASKFSDLRRSSLNIAAALFQITGLAVTSAVTLGMSAFSLYRIDPSNYRVEGAPSAFNFIYLGYKSLLGGSAARIAPVSNAAELLDMITSATNSAIVLVAIVTCTCSPILFNRLLPARPEPKRFGVIILGTDFLAELLGKRLLQDGEPVTFIGRDAVRLEKLREAGCAVVSGPPDDEQVLRQAGAAEARAMVALSNDPAVVTRACQRAREVFQMPSVVARADEQEQVRSLQALGVQVVQPTMAMALGLEGALHYPAAFSALIDKSDQFDFADAPLRNPDLVDRPLRQLHLPGKALVLGIRRRGEGEVVVPHGDTVLREGDVLMLCGDPEAMEEARKWIAGE